MFLFDQVMYQLMYQVNVPGDVPVHPKVARPAGHLCELASFCDSSDAFQPRNRLGLAPGINLPSFILRIEAFVMRFLMRILSSRPCSFVDKPSERN